MRKRSSGSDATVDTHYDADNANHWQRVIEFIV